MSPFLQVAHEKKGFFSCDQTDNMYFFKTVTEYCMHLSI